MTTNTQRKLNAAYQRKLYATSPEARARQVERVRARADAIRALLQEWIDEGECAHCGGPADLFHHVDPATKSFGIGDASASLDRIMEEIEKCILLCRSCHWK